MNPLRPTQEAAAEAWRRLVVAEREQVERLPNRPRPDDFYAPFAGRFKADPRRSDEPLLDALRALVRPDETWIDAGAGGGRYTLAIALLAQRVFAVEPSAGMRAVLLEAAQEYGIDNIEVFDERWPCDSTAPVADVALISQVGYDIAEFSGFLDTMEAHARRLCINVMFSSAPISDWAPLWPAVHGETRQLLPAAGEMLTLLFARGRTPEVRFLDLPPRTYRDLEALHDSARQPLWVLPGSEQDARLEAAVRETAVEVEDGYALSPKPRRLAVITWRPRD